MPKPRRIILDCDPGHDDAVAVMLALGNPAIELPAVTTVGGNQTVEKLRGEHTMGMAVADFRRPPTSDCRHPVATHLHRAGFWEMGVEAIRVLSHEEDR